MPIKGSYYSSQESFCGPDSSHYGKVRPWVARSYRAHVRRCHFICPKFHPVHFMSLSRVSISLPLCHLFIPKLMIIGKVSIHNIGILKFLIVFSPLLNHFCPLFILLFFLMSFPSSICFRFFFFFKLRTWAFPGTI